MEETKLVIIGGGVAGLTAAIYAARANLHPEVLAGPLAGGLLTQTTDVENFPGFPDAVNGFELMDRMQQQAERFGAKIRTGSADKVKLTDGATHEITLEDGTVLRTAAVILATGASPRWLGLDSEERFKGKGVSACATCDGAFYPGVPVVVVGGGDSAMEEALFLTNFASEVHIIHRREVFRASQVMTERVLSNPKIHVHWNRVVSEIFGEKKVEGVRLSGTGGDSDSPNETLSVKGVFIALGHTPNTELFRGQLPTDENGYLILPDRSSRTTLRGVFAAGDCADSHYRQAVTAAGTGCIAALDAERYLSARFR